MGVLYLVLYIYIIKQKLKFTSQMVSISCAQVAQCYNLVYIDQKIDGAIIAPSSKNEKKRERDKKKKKVLETVGYPEVC